MSEMSAAILFNGKKISPQGDRKGDEFMNNSKADFTTTATAKQCVVGEQSRADDLSELRRFCSRIREKNYVEGVNVDFTPDSSRRE